MTEQRQTRRMVYLLDAADMNVGDRYWFASGGTLTYRLMAEALKAQYPDKQFTTGQHGSEMWMRRIK